MSARTDASIKLWTPWRHIGRGSGDLCLGRVCLSVHTEQTSNLAWGWRAPNRVLDSRMPHMRFRRFHLWVGPVLLMVRRWR